MWLVLSHLIINSPDLVKNGDSYTTVLEVLPSVVIVSSFNLEITYDLPAGTYRLGTPCQTLTQGLRIYGIYKGV